jgi:cytochrome c551/c552
MGPEQRALEDMEQKDGHFGNHSLINCSNRRIRRRANMKRITLILFMVGMAGMITAKEGVAEESEKGIRLFKERSCVVCHDPTMDQSIYGLGPSIAQIAAAYKGHEDDLGKFLRGGRDPIVDEAKFSIMHGEIVKIKGLSDSQIKDLQKYICGEQ